MKNRVSKKIKLLILVKSIDGGTGTFLLNLLNIEKMFSKKEIEIKSLVLEKESYRDLGKFKPEYFRKKNFYPQKYSLSPNNFINFFEELFWIKERVSKYESNIILGIDLRCNILAILSKMFFLKNIKVIITNHIDYGRTVFDKTTSILNFILKRVIRYFYNIADVLVGCSMELSKNLKKDFELNKRVITIYNGLDIKSVKRKPLSERKRKVIITIARLSEQKDHINLLKAFNLLLKYLPNTVLWILSDGPERKKLKRYVRQINLTKKVKFFGWVKNISSYIHKSDVFVLSSKREGFAYVLVEAMSHGIPVISTNTPYGPSEVLDNGKYGILVPMNDPVSMKNAMQNILASKEKSDYYSKKSFERSKYFSEKRMLDSYKKILIDLIQ